MKPDSHAEQIKRIALVSQHVEGNGGVYTMLRFLYKIINESGRFRADLVSVPVTYRDATSLRLTAPASWRHGVRQEVRKRGDWEYTHVGAVSPEFEFKRYAPRPPLTRLLAQYDLIQIVSGFPALSNVALPAGKPICAFVATTAAAERQALLTRTPGLRQWWFRLMTRIVTGIEQKVLAQIDHVFAESNYTADLLRPYLSPEKLSVAVPGVDTSVFFPAAAYNAGGPILSVGRFTDPRKNIRLLLEAYADLQERLASTPPLFLVGHTGISDADQALIDQGGLAGSVQVFQDVSLEQLADFYRDASLFVLSSDEEGLGIVILEAMASGLPVISTRCGGPETCVLPGETGELVPVGRKEPLVEAMIHLLQSPDTRAAMRVNSLQLVESRFSLKAAERAYLDVYDQILNR